MAQQQVNTAMKRKRNLGVVKEHINIGRTNTHSTGIHIRSTI